MECFCFIRRLDYFWLCAGLFTIDNSPSQAWSSPLGAGAYQAYAPQNVLTPKAITATIRPYIKIL
jgi:hypothetical protein